MRRLAFSRVRHRFGSIALLSLSVAAAVAFIAASFSLGDAIRAAVYQETAAQAEHVAARATSKDKLFTDRDLTRIRALPGVTAVQPRSDFGVATLERDDGTVVRMPGRPRLSAFVAPVQPRLTDHPLVEGHFPTGSGGLLVQRELADREHWRPGTSVSVLDTARKPHRSTIAGVVDGDIDDGAVGLVPSDYQSWLETPADRGWYALDVAGGSGTEALVRMALAANAEVISGHEYAGQLAVGKLGGGVSVAIEGVKSFAWVAVAVALAVAYNTFGIVLAQRRRELALVRCVGAGRGQVFRAVITEAAIVGLVAAAGGYLLGQTLAALAGFGLRYVGDTAPRSLAVGFSPAAALAALAVGLVVAVLAAVLPAHGATRVAPLRALAAPGELVENRRVGRLRLGGGLLLLVTGLALAAYAGAQHEPVPGIGGGLLAMAALLALGPVIVGPLARFVGWPGRLAGASGRLAAGNGARQPRRTAAATNALTLGIGLVTVMLVGAASLQKTADVELGGAFPVDYQVRSSAQPSDPNASAPLPAGLAAELARRPEFQTPVPVRQHRVDDVRAAGGSLSLDVIGVDPGQMRAHSPGRATLDGALGDFGPGSVVLTKEAADQLGHATAGQTVSVRGARLRVAAVVKGGFETPFGGLTLSAADYTRLFGAGPTTEVLLWKADDVDATAARSALDATIAQLPDVDVRDLAENRGQVESEIDELLAAGAALVAMAMVIAVLGVMTTLTLSVLERRREIAVLRALGLTRGQLYATLTLEGAIMAVLAGVLGAALGLAFGVAGTYAVLGTQDGLELAIPFGRIVLVLVAAALVGLLAALPPARRATRTAPVAALATA